MAQPEDPYREVAATRIRDLSAVNETVPDILRTSATAISLLTNNPVSQACSSPDDPAERAEALDSHTHKLFVLINRTRDQLHKQVRDLESKKVIPTEATRFIPPPQPMPGQKPAQDPQERPRNPEESVINGGLGDLDIGVLNARAGARQQGGDDVLGRVEGIVEELVKRADEDGEKMAIDK